MYKELLQKQKKYMTYTFKSKSDSAIRIDYISLYAGDKEIYNSPQNVVINPYTVVEVSGDITNINRDLVTGSKNAQFMHGNIFGQLILHAHATKHFVGDASQTAHQQRQSVRNHFVPKWFVEAEMHFQHVGNHQQKRGNGGK